MDGIGWVFLFGAFEDQEKLFLKEKEIVEKTFCAESKWAMSVGIAVGGWMPSQPPERESGAEHRRHPEGFGLPSMSNPYAGGE